MAHNKLLTTRNAKKVFGQKALLVNEQPPSIGTVLREKLFFDAINREHIFNGQFEDRDKIAFNGRFQLTYPTSPRHPKFRRLNYFPHEMKYRKTIAEGILYKDCDGINNSIDDIWRPSNDVPQLGIFHSIAGYDGGEEFGILKHEESEKRFDFGNHSGVAFRPTKNHQMLILANSWQDCSLSKMFIAGTQRDIVLLNYSPSPDSYLTSANAFMVANDAPQNMEASAFMVSACSGLFYANVGVDYDFAIVRNGGILTRKVNRKHCLHLNQGDVIVAGCRKMFSVITDEEIIDHTQRVAGADSIAQYCSAAISDSSVCLVETAREKLFQRAKNEEYHANIVCAVAVVTKADSYFF